MEVTYIGHAYFVIRFESGLSVCFDPYSPGSVPGLADCSAVADEVYCSHSHADHNGYMYVIKPDPHYSGPAPEVEIISTFHDDVRGAKRGTNNITVVKSGGETVVHMGDIGCAITSDQLDRIKGCSLLLIPVGGFFTIDSKQAFDMCEQIGPEVIVPMHYSGDGFGYDVISGREDFAEMIKEGGIYNTVDGGSCASLPAGKTLLLMDPLMKK